MTGAERLRPSPGVLHRRVGDGSVLLHIASGRYFELDATGARTWELVLEGRTREELVAALAAEYEAAAGEIEADVDDLVATLLARGLLERP